MTSGLKRDGITSSQIEYIKHMNLEEIKINIASVNEPEKDVVEEFKGLGCDVIQFPNRSKMLLRYILSLYSHIKKEAYDVIHVHGSSSLMAIELLIGKVAGIRKRIAHSRNTTCKYKAIDSLLRPLFYRSYNCALACGKDAGEWLFPNRAFVVLHNGKDLSKFSYNEITRKRIRNKFQIDNDIVIGFVGSLTFQKNILFVLEFFKSFHDTCSNSSLFIMGEGEERENIESFILDNNLKEKVHLMGRISNVNEILQAMDVMILPSRYEGLPNVVLEWQIAGLPSVISDRITKECIVTDFIYSESIDNGVYNWIKKTKEIIKIHNDRKKQSNAGIREMKINYFDIDYSAARLSSIYLDNDIT